MTTKKAVVWLSVLILTIGLSVGMVGGQATCKTTINCTDLTKCFSDEGLLTPDTVVIQGVHGVVCTETFEGSDHYICRPPAALPCNCPGEIKVTAARLAVGAGYGTGFGTTVFWNPKFTDRWPELVPRALAGSWINLDDPTCSVSRTRYGKPAVCKAYGDNRAGVVTLNWTSNY